MKKKKLKSLDLKKRSISNLNDKQIKGGVYPTFTIVSCWSCLSCPTLDCTNGVVCEITKTGDPFDVPKR